MEKKLSSIFDSVSSRRAGPGGAGAGSKGGESRASGHGSMGYQRRLFFAASSGRLTSEEERGRRGGFPPAKGILCSQVHDGG